MNRTALIHMFAVALVSFHSISILDTKNPKQVEVIVHYNGHDDDHIQIERDKLEGQELVDAVKNIVKLRTAK